MRVSTAHLQQLTIFTTVLTGAGVGTMYYLQQNTSVVNNIHTFIDTLMGQQFGIQCLAQGQLDMKTKGTENQTTYQKFSESEYHRLALQKLEACPVAMESLGAPPLKVHNIHLTDKNNRVDQYLAQIKIPVTGSKTGGYLYTFSVRDPNTNRWSLKQAVLKIREGETIDLLNPPPPDSV